MDKGRSNGEGRPAGGPAHEPPDKVLVTGASGFIGGWLARTLHERGYPVRALYRRPVPPVPLEALGRAGVELLRLDLTDPEAPGEAVRGVSTVIHAAALVGDWGSAALFRKLNYQVIVDLLEATKQAGCRSFVFIGSIAVHGFGPHRNSREEGPYYPHVNAYQVSKKMAEDYVLSKNSGSFRTTVIRPGNVYGPGDTTMFYRLLAAQKWWVKGTIGGGHSLTCPVYVSDLVEAVILALESEQSAGLVFNITGGEWITWKELLEFSASLLQVKPFLSLPFPPARLLGAVLPFVYRIFGIKADPPLSRYRVDHLANDFHFSIDRARKILGYEPRVDWREGLRRTAEAYLRETKGNSPEDTRPSDCC